MLIQTHETNFKNDSTYSSKAPHFSRYFCTMAEVCLASSSSARYGTRWRMSSYLFLAPQKNNSILNPSFFLFITIDPDLYFMISPTSAPPHAVHESPHTWLADCMSTNSEPAKDVWSVFHQCAQGKETMGGKGWSWPIFSHNCTFWASGRYQVTEEY